MNRKPGWLQRLSGRKRPSSLAELGLTAEEMQVLRLIVQAHALQERRRWEEALLIYEQALRPGSIHALLRASVYRHKANVLFTLRRWQEALAAIDAAIRLDPTNLRDYPRKGVLLCQLGRYDEALASCRQAIRLNPLYVRAYVNMLLIKLISSRSR